MGFDTAIVCADLVSESTALQLDLCTSLQW